MPPAHAPLTNRILQFGAGLSVFLAIISIAPVLESHRKANMKKKALPRAGGAAAANEQIRCTDRIHRLASVVVFFVLGVVAVGLTFLFPVADCTPPDRFSECFM